MVRAIFELKLLPVLGKRVSVSMEGLYWSLGSTSGNERLRSKMGVLIFIRWLCHRLLYTKTSHFCLYILVICRKELSFLTSYSIWSKWIFKNLFKLLKIRLFTSNFNWRCLFFSCFRHKNVIEFFLIKEESSEVIYWYSMYKKTEDLV